MLTIKRAYESASTQDGHRVLVDRLWPRGLTKEAARLDQWLRELGPSDALRKWFGHDPAKWVEFRRRYEKELAAPDKQELLRQLAAQARKGKVTLVYSAPDEQHNQAVVLRDALLKLSKRPAPATRGPSTMRAKPEVAQRRR